MPLDVVVDDMVRLIGGDTEGEEEADADTDEGELIAVD